MNGHTTSNSLQDATIPLRVTWRGRTLAQSTPQRSNESLRPDSLAACEYSSCTAAPRLDLPRAMSSTIAAMTSAFQSPPVRMIGSTTQHCCTHPSGKSCRLVFLTREIPLSVDPEWYINA